MPNWAVVYAFSDSKRKAYTATKWGYNWGKIGGSDYLAGVQTLEVY